MKKVALFAFNGEPMCFVHVIFNALDMKQRGWDVRVIVEGSATALVRKFEEEPDGPFAPLYRQLREAGLVDCVCQVCSAKMGSLESARKQGLPLCAEMNGHPSIARYMEDGFEVLTF